MGLYQLDCVVSRYVGTDGIAPVLTACQILHKKRLSSFTKKRLSIKVSSCLLGILQINVLSSSHACLGFPVSKKTFSKCILYLWSQFSPMC